jgi:hypothetical protein
MERKIAGVMGRSEKRLDWATCGEDRTLTHGPCTVSRTVGGVTRTVEVDRWHYVGTCDCDTITAWQLLHPASVLPGRARRCVRASYSVYSDSVSAGESTASDSGCVGNVPDSVAAGVARVGLEGCSRDGPSAKSGAL